MSEIPGISYESTNVKGASLEGLRSRANADAEANKNVSSVEMGQNAMQEILDQTRKKVKQDLEAPVGSASKR